MTVPSEARDSFGAAAEGRPAGIGFLLYHANLAWQRALAEVFEPLRITHAQFAVLTAAHALGSSGRLPLQREVADEVGFHPTQTSAVMSALLERGWVTRVADQRDGRASRVQVTPDGAQMAERATAVLQSAEARFFPTGTETSALVSGLRAVLHRPAAGGIAVQRS